MRMSPLALLAKGVNSSLWRYHAVLGVRSGQYACFCQDVGNGTLPDCRKAIQLPVPGRGKQSTLEQGYIWHMYFNGNNGYGWAYHCTRRRRMLSADPKVQDVALLDLKSEVDICTGSRRTLHWICWLEKT
jgi:hypothetical protein